MGNDMDIHDATGYHMIINTALVSPQSIVRLVKDILAAKP